MVAYCPEYKAFDFSYATARRHQQVVLQLNEAWMGKEVHLWGFVVDRAGRASQSHYIGSGILGDFPTETDDNGIDFQTDDAAASTAAEPSFRDAASPDALAAVAAPSRAAPPGEK